MARTPSKTYGLCLQRPDADKIDRLARSVNVKPTTLLRQLINVAIQKPELLEEARRLARRHGTPVNGMEIPEPRPTLPHPTMRVVPLEPTDDAYKPQGLLDLMRRKA